MVSHLNFFFLFFFSFFVTHEAENSNSTVLLHLHRNNPTGLYVTTTTALVPSHWLVDLNGLLPFKSCMVHAKTVSCNSSSCELAPSSSCRKNCSIPFLNPVTGTHGHGQLVQDDIYFRRSGRRTTGFLSGCVPKSMLLSNLPIEIDGFLGLGRTSVGLPAQVSTHFALKQRFSVCLGKSGFVSFGYVNYTAFFHGLDPRQTKPLDYFPLVLGPRGEYYIEVNGMTMDDDYLSINTSLLLIDKKGNGGVQISTTDLYTSLESSIFHEVKKFFLYEFFDNKPTIIAPIPPFQLCFNSTDIDSYDFDPNFPIVPGLDLVWKERKALWRLFGYNMVVKVADDVLCLAFVDAGKHPKAAIVIGIHQLEENLLDFDLEKGRVGVSSYLGFLNITCSNLSTVAG